MPIPKKKSSHDAPEGMIFIDDLYEQFRALLPDDSDQEIAAKMAQFLETTPPAGGFDSEEDRVAMQEWIAELKVFAEEKYQPPEVVRN